MSLNQPTLIEFENERSAINFIPPEGSNSFYEIGNGTINLLVLRGDPDNYKFDLYTNSGTVNTGDGEFLVAGDHTTSPYSNLTVIANTELIVNDTLIIEHGRLDVHGKLVLAEHASLIVREGGNVTFYSDSTFSIKNDCKIKIDSLSLLSIYGDINVHINSVDNILNTKGIIIDSAAVMVVEGMDLLGKRHYSLTDYDTYLRTQVITERTQGNLDTDKGRMSYTWVNGNINTNSQVIKMNLSYGEIIMGDFKYSVLGIPDQLMPDFQQVSELTVDRKATLYVSESFLDYRYMKPDLYIGAMIGNTEMPGRLNIKGKIIVDGKDSSLTLDRGGSLTIEENGELILINNSQLKCTNTEDDTVTMTINGTLIIDSMSQIATFSHDNILIGENGKVIINNPTTSERKVLFSTPIDIETSDLYRLFKDRIDHIEFHVHENTGIIVDKYYEWYSRDFTNWFGGRRFEKAIEDGILVWHDGGFIELHSNIIPWATNTASLYQASRLFKTNASFDNGKLQETVDHLSYVGCGNIVFRFVNDNNRMYSDVTMRLDSVKMHHIVRYPINDTYVLSTEGDGQLFLRNKVSHPTADVIIKSDSRVIDIKDNKAEFTIE